MFWKESFPIIYYLVLALIISILPFLKVYFSVWNRALCKGIIASISGERLFLMEKKSKMEEIKKGGVFKGSIAQYIGYTGTLFATIGLFYLISREEYHMILYSLTGLLILVLLLWIRDFVGYIWILSMVVLLATTLYYNDEIIIKHVAILLPSIILVQSVIGSFQLLKTCFVKKEKRGRQSLIGAMKRFPSILLGVLLLVQSLVACFFIFNTFLYDTEMISALLSSWYNSF